MNNIYKISEFAKRIGKSADTLRRWDKEGRFVAKRHPSGHRYYTEDDISKVLGIATISAIYLEGNGGGDTLDIKALDDGRVELIIGHCCVREIRHIVPVEFITAVLTKAVLSAGGVIEAMQSIGWDQDYTDKLVAKIESV